MDRGQEFVPLIQLKFIGEQQFGVAQNCWPSGCAAHALRSDAASGSIFMRAPRSGPFQGLQQSIMFDANGDTPRKVYFTQIRDGRYVHLP